MTLAMHMANELLNPSTALVTLGLAAAALAVASFRAKKAIEPEKLPLMGVMGAFVFAGQMINFTLPGMPGTSGHLGGGVLLAILLGPSVGILVITAVLTVQCLLFQDGGLLALGCNIINMGVVPCVLGGWLYKTILGPSASAPAWRQYIAAWIACIVGLTSGAALVPIETAFGDRLTIPTADFLTVMVGVHLLIGFVEGLITFMVLAFIRQTRPEALGLEPIEGIPVKGRLSPRAFTASLILTALMLAGVVSWFASTHPDGLEWAYQEHKYFAGADSAVKPMPQPMAAVDTWQSKWSPMSDYGKRGVPLGQEPARDGNAREDGASAGWGQPDGWRSLAGTVGTLVTLVILYAAAMLFRRKKAAS
ncbi:MAG: energy-coupling factor ABC transporter permease [Phycisphaerae bacterium]|jgi:cobalt/nickel transport system permease protein